jgi:hypothetical protein
MTPELERIRQRLIAGLAIRQVAREEGSGRGAVARGVQSDLGMDPRKLLAGTQPDEPLLEQYKHRAAYQLRLVALERSEVYGTELPISWDELNQRAEGLDRGQRSRTATVGRTHAARKGGY